MNTLNKFVGFKPISSIISNPIVKQQGVNVVDVVGNHNLYNSNSVYNSHQLPSSSTPTTSWLTRKDKRLIFSGLNKSTLLSSSSSSTSISSLLSSSSSQSSTSLQKRRLFKVAIVVDIVDNTDQVVEQD
ncbi:hypothetical protein DFA_08110 [Cavenderia fasciculata]|uniref:Uncharacterized protein n=1 Tax=Cavenderia fasciculata TaxID=261658 RepID=F4Q569_CACFS|nr:uncharacterized protein DFA_08110 [Cavenderia fasciculata]EGG17128.1 hypothetical protein DFA_08110 [Cavenderia fasciculata]|eukprot:XP_004355612.1 hypothetical protein DFA_08110 [Cavenderia fasciculata]